MTKYTKGDWRVSGSPSTEGGYAITSGETYIADCYCGGSSEGQAEQGECEGNAQLMAAAPELLELLKRINHAFYVEGTSKAMKEVMSETKKLIHKAEGEV